MDIALKHLGLINTTKKSVWVLSQEGQECEKDNEYLISKHFFLSLKARTNKE